MKSHAANSRPSEFAIAWRKGAPRGYTDLLPAAWFATAQSRGMTHAVLTPDGRREKARCDVAVAGRRADLDYAAYPAFNDHEGMCCGLLRIEFTKPDRRTIARVLWRDPSGGFEPAGVSWQPENEVFREGGRCRVVLDKHERNRKARLACIAHHGVACKGCGRDFSTIYGPEVAGFIQVHHKHPVAKSRGPHAVDPVHDLVPVCPNCHAVIHFGGGCRSIKAVQRMLKQ